MDLQFDHQVVFMSSDEGAKVPESLKCKVKGTITTTEKLASGEISEQSMEVDCKVPIFLKVPPKGAAFFGHSQVVQALLAQLDPENDRGLRIKALGALRFTPDVRDMAFHSRYMLWEAGGAGGHAFGEGTVICGMEGERLRPTIVTAPEYRRAGGRIAAFALWAEECGAACQVTLWRGTCVKASILALTASENDLKVEVAWKGANLRPNQIGDKLPEKFRCFQSALEAAAEKASCESCVHDPHFALARAARQ
jgi:hypothetical protein